MPALTDIQELSRNAQKLLKAAGVRSATELAAADPADLLADLARANKKIRLYKRVPSLETIEGWVEAANLTAHAPTAAEQPSNLPLSQEQFEEEMALRRDRLDRIRRERRDRHSTLVALLPQLSVATDLADGLALLR